MSFTISFVRQPKAYTSLNTNNRIADIAVTSDAVSGTYLFYLLDGFDLIVKLLSVDRDNLAFLKFYLQQTLILFRDMLSRYASSGSP